MKLYVHGMPIEFPGDDPAEIGQYMLDNYQREDYPEPGPEPEAPAEQ